MQDARELSTLERYYATRVAALAGRTFAAGVESTLLRRYAEDAVVALLRGARVTTYVPELALRAVREAVECRVVTADRWVAALPGPRFAA